MNTLLLSLSQICLIILALMFVLRKVKQPYMVAYMLAGVLLGPHVTGAITQVHEIEAIGEVGILLLMFFLGMEIDIPDNRNQLTQPLAMQGVRMILAFIFALIAGMPAGWSAANIALLALLFMFNSTAVVTEYLRKNNELSGPLGKSILNILVLQDILLAPAMTLLQFLGKEQVTFQRLIGPVAGSILIVMLFRFIRNRHLLKLPLLPRDIHRDHDLQVFCGLLICLGFGVAAAASGLSSALGSFVAGIFIGRMKAFRWLESALRPFKIFFTALFFLSVGLRLDLAYVASAYGDVLAGTLLILFSNSILSAIAFRTLKYSWKDSFYGGALLSQIGEFGILVLTLAQQMRVISYGFFKAGIAITALTLLLSTLWISVFRRLFFRSPPAGRKAASLPSAAGTADEELV